MRRKVHPQAVRLTLALLAASVLGILTAGRPLMANEGIRPPAVAGMFYPASAKELRQTVEGFLAKAQPDVPADLKEKAPLGIIVPHAGYEFSGATAAMAFKLLEGRPRPSRVVLMGPSHHFPLMGRCAVSDYAEYSTPLGNVPVDGGAVEQLVQSGLFAKLRAADAPEHCLEVQVPFIQTLWPEPPSIVPVLVGQLTASQRKAAAAQIARVLDEHSLLIISTDFTHYGPNYDYAPFRGTPAAQLHDKIKDLDMGAVQQIEKLDGVGFQQYVDSKKPTICGREAVGVALELFGSSPSSRAAFLKWSNSGEASSDYANCVSYVTTALYAPPGALEAARKRLEQAAAPPAANTGELPALGEADKRLLLQLARQTLEDALHASGAAASAAPRVNRDQMPDALSSACGVFVTLTKNSRLRGCIGFVESNLPLSVSVPRAALLAALRDTRFEPVRADELRDISIEISVLSPVKPVANVQEILVGRDGLIIKSDGNSGLLLPQVATENGWNRDEFLKQTCRKAGLPDDAWRSSGTSISRFTATVFNEQELKPK
jgi:hypothetical protein